jgi:esterase
MQLNHKKYGETGNTIIIIHGIFGSLDNWHTVAKELGESFQVYTLDMRNHGYSPHSDEMSIDLMVQDVKEFCTELNLFSINLVGHSMGGKVAMAFADLHPQLLSKLIVVDIAPKAYKAGHNPYFKAYEEIDLTNISNRNELDDAFLPYEENVGVRLFLMKNIVSNGNGGYELKINVAGIKNGYDEIIGAINLNTIATPTLFIKGEKSNYILEEDDPLIGAHFTNYKITSVPHAGHWVHAENKDGFIAVTTQFLA